jgi:hypothetical protein
MTYVIALVQSDVDPRSLSEKLTSSWEHRGRPSAST